MKKALNIAAISILLGTMPMVAEELQNKETATGADNYNKVRVGGYGEIIANWKDYGLNRFNGSPSGNTKKNHSEISIPRFVLALDYKFNSKWILGAEVEIEAGGTGQTFEMESGAGSENGEYETEVEKGGEVALEQFHITRLIAPEFNIRAGHMIVPVGLTNAHHEPINFFGSSRPEGETSIIPCTWHETGIEVFGEFGKGLVSFDYEAMIVTGLNPNGFDMYNWVKGGKQGAFETDNFTSPAYVARINWTGVKGLRLGGSVYYCPNAGKNSDKLNWYDNIDDINVFIYSFDAKYQNRFVTAQANYLNGSVSASKELSEINSRYSKLSPYSLQGPIAKRATTYSIEAGINLKSVFSGVKNFPTVYPFAHYEYYNPQFKGVGTQVMDKRCEVSMWTVGLNWKPLPNLVVKADYTTRQIVTDKIFGTGKFNSENEFAVCLAYTGWFFKK